METAERFTEELVGHAQRYALADFLAFGKAVQQLLSLRNANAGASPEQLRVAMQYWRASGWHILFGSSDFALTVANSKNIDEISAIVDEELDRIERNQVLAISPETLRIKGELLLLQRDSNRALASHCFLRSLDRARAQGAPSWELRTAMSLAGLKRTQGRMREAHQILQGVYDRFTQGFGTSDLKHARKLLDELNAASGA